MSLFLGVVRHEFSMSIRRKGLWIAYIALFLFFSISLFTPEPGGNITILAGIDLQADSALMLYHFNLFLPLVAGLLAGDRLQRDQVLGIRELQNSTPLPGPAYVMVKYLGVLLSLLLPVFLWTLLIAAVIIANGEAPISFFGMIALAFMTITVPAFSFVTAFSLALPLIIPLRVYQVLFTGYWFWGNFLNADNFPTLNGTLLTPSGIFAMQGFFGGYFESSPVSLYTPSEAWLNLLILVLCITAVLVCLERYLSWKLHHA